MADIGPYSRPTSLAKLDGRTREARLMRAVRDDLTSHLGGNLTAPQKALVERAAWLSLHIALMDEKTMTEGGPGSERDSRQYLAWSNALTRILRDLGADQKPGQKPQRTLKDIIGLGAAA